ncbi:MAG: hypothetical protein ACPG31_04935 [Planctomycetota bacterium]
MKTPGLSFTQPVQDLGELWAGEVHVLEFPFEVHGEAVRIETALPDCGCLAPQLLVNGTAMKLPVSLDAGTKGVLRVEYHTAGFQGRKFTGVDLTGAGAGLPMKLEVQSWLRPWFSVEPRALDYGSVTGEQDVVREIMIRGQEPFRITEILAASPPIEVLGVPSAEAKLEHVLRMRLPANTREGNHFGVFNFGTDREGFTFNLPMRFTVAGNLWTLPPEKLLLGTLKSGVEHFSTIEVGARVGHLETPEVTLENLPGGAVRIETVVEGSRYRVQLGLSPNSEHVGGTAVVKLPYTDAAGNREVVERRIRVFGVVQ